MNAAAASWTPDPFATQFERRDDGSLILRPLGELAPYPRTTRGFIWSFGRAPRRIACWSRGAMRAGAWRHVTYAQMLARVQRLAGGLLTRESLPRKAHRHPVRQQHRAPDACAGRDVGRNSVLPRIACLLAGDAAISPSFGT